MGEDLKCPHCGSTNIGGKETDYKYGIINSDPDNYYWYRCLNCNFPIIKDHRFKLPKKERYSRAYMDKLLGK